MIHRIKILPEYYTAVQVGKKNFEVRYNDRNYQIGDTVILQEWEAGRLTGNQLKRKIEYMYLGEDMYGLEKGYCVLGMKQEKEWVPVGELLPFPFRPIYATCRAKGRPNFVIETYYITRHKKTLIWGDLPEGAEIIAWMYQDIPEVYEDEDI